MSRLSLLLNPKLHEVSSLNSSLQGMVTTPHPNQYPRTEYTTCVEPRAGLNQMNDATDRRMVPLQDKDLPGNDPHLVSSFPRLYSGTVSECVRIRRFKRNSFNLERATKMRDSVLLNSWDSFLVTLLSIYLETCVIYFC